MPGVVPAGTSAPAAEAAAPASAQEARAGGASAPEAVGAGGLGVPAPDARAARPLQHAPYVDALRKPFSIGLAPLDEADWLDLDPRRDGEIAQKAGIFAAEPTAVMIEPGTEAAQAELLALVRDHLARRGVAAEEPPAGPDIVRAALMVQDDLVLMRRGDSGWRLVAAALAFPSNWLLEAKFGRPMDEIHAVVPGWEGQMAGRVGRIFDGLRDGIVWRLNWSIQFGGGLRLARVKDGAPPGDIARAAIVRVERQTLRRLPGSGDILFTIKVMLDEVSSFRAHPDGARLAHGLAGQLAALNEAQLDYKGLREVRDRMLDALGEIARR